MTTTKTTRRGDTGKPGNAGKFDGQTRPDGADVIDFAQAARRAEVNQLLDGCRNGLGEPLSADTRDAIGDYAMRGGDTDTWQSISSKLIGGHRTLWQATLAHSDYDIRRGRVHAVTDKGFAPFRPVVTEQTNDWEAVPTADNILDALRGVAASIS